MTTVTAPTTPTTTAGTDIHDKLVQLSVAFAPAQIGKKPKGKAKPGEQREHCRVCGGYHEPSIRVHLEFVGHAVVTNRLNTVAGPGSWSYTIDEIVASGGHVQAVIGTMTILGRTIGPEVGEPERQSNYGDELKAAISDYIRRAAMRFGVALDLWAKQDLEQRPDADDASSQPSGRNGSSRHARQKSETATPSSGSDSKPAVSDRPAAAGTNGDRAAAGTHTAVNPLDAFKAMCGELDLAPEDAQRHLVSLGSYGDLNTTNWQGRIGKYWDAERLTQAHEALTAHAETKTGGAQ